MKIFKNVEENLDKDENNSEIFNTDFDHKKIKNKNKNNDLKTLQNCNKNNNSNINYNKKLNEIKNKINILKVDALKDYHNEEDFNSYFYLNANLSYVLHNITTKEGSIKCQIFLSKCNSNDIKIFIYRIKDNIFNIVKSLYGFFLIQELIYHLDKNNRRLFFDAIQDIFINMCNNYYGSRTIQMFISNTKNSDEEKKIMETLNSKIELLLCNEFGCYVLRSVIKFFHFKNLECLFDYIKFNIFIIATNKNSVGILIDFFSQISLQNLYSYKSFVIMFFCKNFINLIINKYGYLAICYILDWKLSEIYPLIYQIAKSYVFISNQFYGRRILDIVLFKKMDKDSIDQFCYDCLNNITSLDDIFSNKNSEKNFIILLNNFSLDEILKYQNSLQEANNFNSNNLKTNHTLNNKKTKKNNKSLNKINKIINKIANNKKSTIFQN